MGATRHEWMMSSWCGGEFIPLAVRGLVVVRRLVVVSKTGVVAEVWLPETPTVITAARSPMRAPERNRTRKVLHARVILHHARMRGQTHATTTRSELQQGCERPLLKVSTTDPLLTPPYLLCCVALRRPSSDPV